jgi:DNA-binding transcriptional LysR family regulator
VHLARSFAGKGRCRHSILCPLLQQLMSSPAAPKPVLPIFHALAWWIIHISLRFWTSIAGVSRKWGCVALFTRRTAAAGMGLALLPQFLAVEELVSGRPVCPYDVSLRNENAYYITHANGAGRNRSIQLFKEWLLAQVPG